MVFTKDSGLVKVWVGNVKSRMYTKEQIPEMFNLKEVVWQVLEESTK